MKLVLITN